MSFSDVFKTTLFSSIQLDNVNLKETFFNFVLKLARHNEEFFNHLKGFLHSKGVFKFSPNLIDGKTIAMFSRQNYIIISTLCLDLINAESKFASLLEFVLRHELTHANDLALTKKRGFHSSNEILRFRLIANALFNALHTIFSSYKVNKYYLDSLSKLFEINLHPEISYIMFWNFQYSMGSPEKYYNFIDVINAIGFSIVLNGGIQTQCITSAHRHDGIILFEQTNNLARLHSAYKHNIFKYQSYVEYFDLRELELEFWRQLSESQRNILDSLIVLYQRVVSNVERDEKCFTPFKSCLDKLEQDCLEAFVQCQIKYNELAAGTTTIEIRAVLHERSSGRLLNATIFENLVAADTCPSKTVTEQSASEATSNSRMGFSYGFALSFFDALADSIINQCDLSTWKKYLAKNILSASLFGFFAAYGLGFSLTEILVMKLINIIINFAKSYLNLPKISLFGTEFNTFETAMTISGLYATDSFYDMIMTMVGNFAGDISYNALVAVPRFFSANNSLSKSIDETYNQCTSTTQATM